MHEPGAEIKYPQLFFTQRQRYHPSLQFSIMNPTALDHALAHHITGPLSPGKPVPCLENATIPAADLFLTLGSTIEHRTNGVTYIIRPDGTELGWGYDNQTKQFNTATGTILVSSVYIAPSGSVIIPVPNDVGRVDIRDPLTNATLLKTINENVNAVDLSSNSVGVCVPKEGCSSGVISNEQYFMDAPVSSTGTTGSGIPVLSDHHLADGSQVVTISELGSTDPAKSTSIHSDGIDGDQGLTLNVINATTGKGLFLTAKADVTGGDAALHYNITGTSSVDGPGISLTPRIYKLTPAGDVLVFTGNAKKCTSRDNLHTLW